MQLISALQQGMACPRARTSRRNISPGAYACRTLDQLRPCLPARAVLFPSCSIYGRIGYNRKALSHIIFFLLSSGTSGSSRISCTATA